MASKSRKIDVVMRGGGSIVMCRPAFSRDSKYIICASGCMVQVYSVDNDVCCKSMRGHTAAVTSIFMNPKNEFQLFSSSLDKSVICWNYLEGVLLHRYLFLHPIWSIFSSTDCQYYGVLQMDKDLQNCGLFEFSLRQSDVKGKTVNAKLLQRSLHSHQNHTAISYKGSFMAFITGKTNVCVIGCKQAKKFEFKAKQMLSCIACHPTDYCIATGNKSGQIHLWRNFMTPGVNPVSTELHWHSLNVHCLMFSVEGSYLLSGGHECVLAKWMTDSTSRKPADTLPRLGSQIVNISSSTDNRFYGVCFADNGIQVIGNNFFCGHTIQGLIQGYQQSANSIKDLSRLVAPVGLLWDPRSAALVLNGRPGQLQFFNPDKNHQLFSFDVVGHNYVSPENLDKPLKPTNIENAAFDSTGMWMVTYERRDDGVTAAEARLKFWHYSLEKNTFVLNTCVDTPHQSRLTGLSFRPNQMLEDKRGAMVVSSSMDGSIKTWCLISEASLTEITLRWSCAGVGEYRNQYAGPLDFSEDGSVLAVVFKDVVTLWYPDYCCMYKDIISVPDNKLLDVLIVRFGSRTSSHMLVFGNSEKLYCWNMLTFSVQWCLSLNVTSVIVNPLFDVMAIFTSDKRLLIMSPKSSVPLYNHMQISREPVLMACFVPHSSKVNNLSWEAVTRLYFLTSNQELYSLFGDDTDYEALDKTAPLQQNVEKQTILSVLMETDGKGKGVSSSSVNSVHQKTMTPAQSKFIDKALSNQFIAMPPMSLLCMSFMEALLVKQSENLDDDSDEDIAGDVTDFELSSNDSDMDTL